ncbi:MarR family winged helix-turn-helix transcriptional regulator [Nocardioides sp. SYSU DS0651]|uniref:MarR family winged helix-turn-helix transcriptional regulator n=1 Tax=Nocardioides sp. SYSU DS0651 TaxID=3415955 RepID=UPI003F4C80FD
MDEEAVQRTDAERRDRATDAVLAVSRTMTAIVARTLSDLEDDITVPQLRVLVLLSSRGPLNLSAVAEQLGVNPSNASRTCERLVLGGRIRRGEDAGDRRNVVLSLTAEGERLVDGLMLARRRIIDDLVRRMSADEQDLLERGLVAFSRAVSAAPVEDTTGLADERIIPWLL